MYRPLGPALERLRETLRAWLQNDDRVDEAVAAIAATAEAVTIAELTDDLAQVRGEMNALRQRIAADAAATELQLASLRNVISILAARQDQLSARVVMMDHRQRLDGQRPH